MKYADGSPVTLGDVIVIPLADRRAKARVVMFGDTGEHLFMDEGFIEWIKEEGLLDASQLVVEWLDENPLAHNDPKYSPVGNYLLTHWDSCFTRVA